MRDSDRHTRDYGRSIGSMILVPVALHADKVAVRRASRSSRISSRSSTRDSTRSRRGSSSNSSSSSSSSSSGSISNRLDLKRYFSKQSDRLSSVSAVGHRRVWNEVSRRTGAHRSSLHESESAGTPRSARLSSGCRLCPCRRQSSCCVGLARLWQARALRDKLAAFIVAILGFLLVTDGAVGLVIEEPFQESFKHVPAVFGPDILLLDPPIASRPLVSARPRDACVPLYNSGQMEDGVVALVERGKCNFTEKVLNVQQAGASAVIVTDLERTEHWYMAMSGSPEQTAEIRIPAVFVSHETGERLWSKRLWPSSGRIRASINATGHVALRPRSIGVLETLGVYILVSMLLIGFSGLCGVLFAFAVSWYQRLFRTRAMRRLRTFTFRRPPRRATRGAPGTTTTAVLRHANAVPASSEFKGTNHAMGSSAATGGGGSLARRLTASLAAQVRLCCRANSADGGQDGVRVSSGDSAAAAAAALTAAQGSGEGGSLESQRMMTGNGGGGGGGGDLANGMRAEDDTCAICLDLYENGDTLTALPCRHFFHEHCIGPWLSSSGLCPICKTEAFAPMGRKVFSTFVSTAGSRLELALAELTELCTDNLFMLGAFFMASVACGVVAAEFSVRGGG